MASLNKVFLMGNLTRNPELRSTPSGLSVCELGLAVNRSYSSSDGRQKKETLFIDVNVWGQQAEATCKYLQKGAPVFIEGRLQYETWEDKDKVKRSRYRVVAERIQFLSRGGGGAGGDGQEHDESQERQDDDFPGSQRPRPAQQQARPGRPAQPAPDKGGPGVRQMPVPPDNAFEVDGQQGDDIPF